jgi:uncharacterized protein YegL
MKKFIMVLFVILSLSLTVFVYYHFFSGSKQGLLDQSRPQFDIFLLIDHSGSMKGDKMDPIPSDPDGIRVKAAQYFVDYLQYFSDPKSKNRISIINFGSDTPEPYQLPLTEINTPEKNKKIKEMIKEYSLGYTNFHQALTKVREYYQKAMVAGENRQPLVIIFTDGEPKDSRSLTKDKYFEELTDYIDKNFRNIPVERVIRPVNFEFFIIALDAEGAYWEKDRPFWDKLTGKKTYVMKKANEEELENIYGKIIEVLFTTQAGEWYDLSTGTEKEIIIPPYVEKVVISVKKDINIKNQKLNIISPEGELLQEGPKLLASPTTGMILYALIEPEPGKWKLTLTPSGKVRFKSDMLPTKLDITKPRSIHPLYEPIEVEASFLKSDGTPLKPLEKYPLSFSATVKAPDGRLYKPVIIAEPTKPGLYRSVERIPADNQGIYEVDFEVRVGSFLETGNFTLTKSSVRVESKPIIYFKIIKPSLKDPYTIYNFLTFWKQAPFTIEGKLLRNGKVVPPQELAGQKLSEIVLAQVEKEKGQGISNVTFLHYDKQKNCFQGTLKPERRLSPGKYNFFTRIEWNQSDNSKYIREDNNAFIVKYGFGVIGWVFVAIFVFYTILQILWRSVRSPLRGQLFVNGQPLNARLGDFIFYNKARIVSRKCKFSIPWINTLKHDGDKHGSKTCPTFYVIGDSYKAKGGRSEPAVVVYHRIFCLIPWWTKLYQGRNTTSINGFSIRWQP